LILRIEIVNLKENEEEKQCEWDLDDKKLLFNTIKPKGKI
jgi:hypothetical protein